MISSKKSRFRTNEECVVLPPTIPPLQKHCQGCPVEYWACHQEPCVFEEKAGEITSANWDDQTGIYELTGQAIDQNDQLTFFTSNNISVGNSNAGPGLGVKGTPESGIAGQLGYDPTTLLSEAIQVKFSSKICSLSFSVSNLYENEGTGEQGNYSAYLNNQLVVSSNFMAPPGQNQTTVQVAIPQGQCIDCIIWTATPYAGGQNNTNDSSDYWITRINFTYMECNSPLVGKIFQNDGVACFPESLNDLTFNEGLFVNSSVKKRLLRQAIAAYLNAASEGISFCVPQVEEDGQIGTVLVENATPADVVSFVCAVLNTNHDFILSAYTNYLQLLNETGSPQCKKRCRDSCDDSCNDSCDCCKGTQCWIPGPIVRVKQDQEVLPDGRAELFVLFLPEIDTGSRSYITTYLPNAPSCLDHEVGVIGTSVVIRNNVNKAIHLKPRPGYEIPGTGQGAGQILLQPGKVVHLVNREKEWFAF